MRKFFSDKPGAKFFANTNVTLHVMPDYVEYIVKLDRGYYGVVNLMAESCNKVSLLCFGVIISHDYRKYPTKIRYGYIVEELPRAG